MTPLLVAIIVGLSYAVQSTFGFGAGLISLPFLTMLIGAKTSIGMNLIFQTLTGFLLFTVHKNISFKPLPIFLACVCVGIILGSLFLHNVDDGMLEVMLGLYLVFYGSKQLWGHHFPKQTAISNFKQSPLYAIAWIPGGLISGAFGTGGPMMVSYIKSLNLNKDGLRATILFVMFFCNIVRVSMTWQTGQFDEQVFHYALYASPLFLVGIFSGNWISKRLSEQQFRSAINVILLIAGLSLLVRHFLVGA
jgi:uncharacterized protein